ncbi:DUF4625 domain-containing protein [Fulvivirga maritima]|uniref:DUF4625 domain-containing protein n=1 Tax=Fulvivirga maritima TaxID=2904247 RepID=UPI001F2FBD75|nr:DUF4625 domain-containing protein [Fulvivirga maritima]UII26782.1 DUF4625 domain-containing protein [Fulvivirga maritima]
MRNIVILCILSTAIIFSCGDSETPLPEQPEINVVQVHPHVETLEICGENDPRSIALTSADTLAITFNLKGQNGLSQYKIDLHSNFDCHTHGRINQAPWYVLKVEEVEGSEATVDERLIVPQDVQAGNYHFMLQLLDQKGNEAEAVLYSLQVKNVGDIQAPNMQLINPSEPPLQLVKTEPVEFSYAISDNELLYGGRVDVTYISPSGQTYTAAQYYFTQADGEEFTYNFNFDFPTLPTSGEYTFMVKVYDATGNVTEESLEVIISD